MSPIPTSLPDLDECVKQILRNPPPPRANRALKYHKNPPHSPTLARGWGGRDFNIIDKCIISVRFCERFPHSPIHLLCMQHCHTNPLIQRTSMN